MGKLFKAIFKWVKGALTTMWENFHMNELDSAFIILVILTFIGCFIALVFALQKNRKFKAGKTLKGFIKVFMVGIISGIIGLIPMQKGSGWWFALCFVVAVLWGMLLTRNMLRKQKWSSRESFTPELLFIICASCIGGLGFFLVFNAFNVEELHTAFTLTAFGAVMPWLMMKSHDYWTNIPEPQYNYWEYDPFADKPSFLGMQQMNMRVELAPRYMPKDAPLQLPLRKEVIIPIQDSLGKFFQKFFMDYNAENTSPIEDLNKNGLGEDIAWVFYYFPNENSRKRKYLDPYLSLFQNDIKIEYTTIYVERIIKPDRNSGGGNGDILGGGGDAQSNGGGIRIVGRR
jgi:hypothetical protein